MNKLIVVVFLLVSAAQAWGDLTAGEYEKLKKGSKTDKFAAEMYIGGVGKGYLFANATLDSNKQQPLFCYDGDYTTKQFMELADQQLKYIYGIDPNEKNIPMELVLLMKLQKMHPCK